MQWIKLVAQVLSGAWAAASLYGFFDSLSLDEAAILASLTVSEHFLRVGYVFAFAIGVFLLVGLFWEWVSKWGPLSRLLIDKPKRFEELYPEIVERRKELIAVIEQQESKVNNFYFHPKVIELTASLEGLGIPFPKMVPNIDRLETRVVRIREWYEFLVRLAARSREHDLKGGRKVMVRVSEVMRAINAGKDTPKS